MRSACEEISSRPDNLVTAANYLGRFDVSNDNHVTECTVTDLTVHSASAVQELESVVDIRMDSHQSHHTEGSQQSQALQLDVSM